LGIFPTDRSGSGGKAGARGGSGGEISRAESAAEVPAVTRELGVDRKTVERWLMLDSWPVCGETGRGPGRSINSPNSSRRAPEVG